MGEGLGGTCLEYRRIWSEREREKNENKTTGQIYNDSETAT
jgi:hypothetical protein